MLDASLVCKDCGFEFKNHAINATLEYENIGRGKLSKIKKDEVKEKEKDSPKKLSQLRKDVSYIGLGQMNDGEDNDD